ncbi:ABC transporter permease [Candidatus Saccharibacteria bacterium]|nr:MAG: ABC transporter permease [Candidatus Saccharibacteria bacterium]
MKKAFLPVLTFAKIDIRRLFRDKLAIFFTFVFPLLFLFVFGGIFGRNNTSVSFNVAFLNRSNTEFARQFEQMGQKDKVLKIDSQVKNLDEAQEKMSRGELDATIILPPEFGQVGAKGYPTGEAQVLYNKSNEQGGQTLASVLNSIFEGINKQFVPTEKPFTVTAKSTAKQGLTQFDYVFAGLLGFSLLGAGIFGPTSVFPKLKERGVLRRYHTTTLKVWQYFLGNVISNTFVGLMSIVTMFVVGLTVFNLNMRGNYLVLGLLVTFGAIMLFGIGLAVGGWAKNERQAAPLAQIITFPMMFLSGSFFPRFLMPEWLQGVTNYLPLTPVIDGARLIITENRGVFDLLPQFGIILGWTIVVYILAFRFFRWE